jgi:membrane protein
MPDAKKALMGLAVIGLKKKTEHDAKRDGKRDLDPKDNRGASGSDEQKRPPRGWRGAFALVKDSASEWNKDAAPRLGAALSYYTVFALAPVLLLAISVAGLVFGNEAAQGQIVGELRGLFGDDTAKMVQEMLAKSSTTSSGVIGTVVGFVTLIIGATAVMIELESALNSVFKVKRKSGRGIKGAIKDRVLSLGLILSLGFLLVVSLVASAVLTAVGGLLDRFSFPGAAIVSQLLANAVSLGVIGLLFAVIFKFLPDTTLAWRDVWIGAFVTSALFHVGKILIGIYLGQASVASTFGAAGSLAVLLVWVYYTAQIVLFGAEMTRLVALRYGSGVHPDADAVCAPRLDDHAVGVNSGSSSGVKGGASGTMPRPHTA